MPTLIGFDTNFSASVAVIEPVIEPVVEPTITPVLHAAPQALSDAPLSDDPLWVLTPTAPKAPAATSSVGYEDGYANGLAVGYSKGYAEGYEAALLSAGGTWCDHD